MRTNAYIDDIEFHKPMKSAESLPDSNNGCQTHIEIMHSQVCILQNCDVFWVVIAACRVVLQAFFLDDCGFRLLLVHNRGRQRCGARVSTWPLFDSCPCALGLASAMRLTLANEEGDLLKQLKNPLSLMEWQQRIRVGINDRRRIWDESDNQTRIQTFQMRYPKPVYSSLWPLLLGGATLANCL